MNDNNINYIGYMEKLCTDSKEDFVKSFFASDQGT